jgi:outer membrane protein OmpA-like peptidoglycan-associated protein
MMAEVHFESNSAQLTTGAQARARAAVNALEGMDLARVDISGFTDTVGSASANAALGKARAEAVADFLVEAGLPRELIQVAGMGETGAPVPTADGVAEPLNRCVGIMPVLAGDQTTTASN